MRCHYYAPIAILISFALWAPSGASATTIDLSAVAPTVPVPQAQGTGLNGTISNGSGSATFNSAVPSYIANTDGVGDTVALFLGNKITGDQDTGSTAPNSDVSTLTPAAFGTQVAENFNVVLSGYLAVPAAGTYNVYQSSDDGATVTIGGSVIDSTSYHNPQENQVTFSKPGLYPILVNLNQGGGGVYYQLGFNANGSDATDSTVATSLLFSAPVPEPSTLILGGLGLVGLLMAARRRRQA